VLAEIERSHAEAAAAGTLIGKPEPTFAEPRQPAMSLQCWKCGATLTLLLPLSRTETCPSCRAPLHTCRNVPPLRRRACQAVPRTRRRASGRQIPRQLLRLVCAASRCLSRGGAAVAQSSRPALDALLGGQPDAAPAKPNLLDDLFKK